MKNRIKEYIFSNQTSSKWQIAGGNKRDVQAGFFYEQKEKVGSIMIQRKINIQKHHLINQAIK